MPKLGSSSSPRMASATTTAVLLFLLSSVGVVLSETVDLSFGQWCYPYEEMKMCVLRVFTLIGGELLLMDSGSSAIGFCEDPDPTQVLNPRRFDNSNAGGKPISQCMMYGARSHGWYGDSYAGNVSIGDGGDFVNGLFYSVMEKAFGEVGNACGEVMEGSVGLELSPIRGIFGIGNSNTYTYTDSIRDKTWDPGNTPVCPKSEPIAAASFVQTVGHSNEDLMSISWDGTLGKDSGKLVLGKDASNGIPSTAEPLYLSPKKLASSGSDGFYETNVTDIELNGRAMSTEMIPYVFDTGSPYISLPSNVFESVWSSNTTSKVIFSILTLDGGDEQIEVTITPELMRSGNVFQSVSNTSVHLFGLHVLRYVETILLGYDTTSPKRPYMKMVPRDTPITTPTANLTRSGAPAGSITNATLPTEAVDAPAGVPSSGAVGGRFGSGQAAALAAVASATVLWMW